MRKLITFLLISLSLHSHAAIKVYFSDLSGNDVTGNGSFALPYKSLDKLNSIIETLADGDSAFFKRNETYFGKVRTNAFQWAHFVITAYGTGADPVFTGFVKLGVWENLGNNLYRSDVPYITNGVLNMVRINGVTTRMGRYPDEDAPNGGFLTYESSSEPRTGNIVSSSLLSEPSWIGAQVIVRKNQWVLDRATVTGQSGSTLTFTDPSGQKAIDNFGFFFQNHLRALNRQNEWAYLTSSFYLYSTVNPATLDVRVAVFDTLFTAGFKINMDIQHITFEGSNVITVSLENTPGLIFKYNTVRHSGLDGVRAIGGDGIISMYNKIFDCNNSGWYSIAYNTLAQYNEVFDCGRFQGMGRSMSQSMVGLLAYGDSAKIWDNKISRIGYYGLGFGDNHALVFRNRIDSACLSLSDGGGIYTSGPTKESGITHVGRVLMHNTITNTVGNEKGTNLPLKRVQGMGVYLDDRSTGVVIKDNTIDHVNEYGIYVHNGQDIVIEGNTINNADEYGVCMNHDILEPDMPIRRVVMRNNRIYNSNPLAGAIRLFSRIEDDIASYGVIENNIYNLPNPRFQTAVQPSVNTPQDFTVSAWRSTYTYDQGSTVNLVTAPPDSISMIINPDPTIRVVAVQRVLRDADGSLYPFTVALPPYSSKVLTMVADRPKRVSVGVVVNPSRIRF
jgi:parallel beta-helix repeat protein